MEWLKQSYKKPPFGPHAQSMLSERSSITSNHFYDHAALAVLIAAGLLCPACAFSFEASGTYSATHSTLQMQDTLHRMSDDDLRHVAAQGFNEVRTDRLFADASTYMGGGNAVTVLGELGVWLNPATLLIQMLNAEAAFRNIIFNPASPNIIVGSDGTTAYMLRGSTIDDLRYQYVSNAAGKTEVRNIEMKGTKILIKQH